MGYFNFQNNITPANDTNLNAMQKGLMELVFPVGSTYVTQSDTNPSTILGFGTWERFKGLIALGLDEDDEDLNEIGKTGGQKTHKHKQTMIFTSEYEDNSGARYASGESMPTDPIYTEEASNMMPYEVVGYMWIRRS